MKTLNTFSLAALLTLSTGGVLFAQQGPKPKIPEATARATALAQVPGGKFQAQELETEDGKLIYSYEIKVPGKSGIEEVNIDAMTGKVVSREHEGPKAEKKEGDEKDGKGEAMEAEERGEAGEQAEAAEAGEHGEQGEAAEAGEQGEAGEAGGLL